MIRLSLRKNSITSKVVKVLALFTGLQSFIILCSIVRVKLVAIWLGTVGVGLFGIYQTTVDSLGTLTEMGLRESAVREVSRTKKNLLFRLLTVIRRWSAFSGIIGALAIVALSPILADTLLDSTDRWWTFAILSAAMLFKSLLNGEQAILQGSDRLRHLAKASFAGSLLALLVSIPMFKWLGNVSVPLSIAAYALCMYLCVLAYRIKAPRAMKEKKPDWKVTLRSGSSFAKLGLSLALATFVENIARLVFLGWLNNQASLDTVGYYQAGYTIVVRYVGMIFSAVMMEFYPRISASIHSHRATNLFLNHEIALLLKILVPIVIVLLIFKSWIINLLYSPDFNAAVPFIAWAVCGIPFRVVSTCMATVILGRGDGKAYIFTETVDSLIGLLLNIILYNTLGLAGLGIAYMLWYLAYCVLTGIVCFGKYRLRLSASTWTTILASLLILTLLNFIL